MFKLGSRRYWAVFAAFLAIAVIRALVAAHYEGSIPEFVTEPTAQVRELRMQELFIDTIPSDAIAAGKDTVPEALHGPVYIEAGPYGHLFASDAGDGEVIKEFSSDGQLLNVFDEFGRANISSVTDMVVAEDRLWVADLLGSSLHVLDRPTGVWTTLPLDFQPYRLEVVGDGEELVVMRIGAPEMFVRMSPDGEVLDTFGLLLHDQEADSLALDGFIARSGERVVFSGKWLGALASFLDDDLTFLVEPIRGPSKPVIMEDFGTQAKWLRHGPVPASRDIAADQDRFYVLTRRQIGVEIRSVIDVYDSRDGAYQKTLLLPLGDKWRSLAVSDESFFAAGLQSVGKWPAALLRKDNNPNQVSTGRLTIRFKASNSQPRSQA